MVALHLLKRWTMIKETLSEPNFAKAISVFGKSFWVKEPSLMPITNQMLGQPTFSLQKL